MVRVGSWEALYFYKIGVWLILVGCFEFVSFVCFAHEDEVC